MNPVWIAGNAVSIVAGLICVSYLVWVRRKPGDTGFPFITLALIGLTATITAEKLYGKGLLAVFLGAGLLSQIFLSVWLPYSGGSSSAAFGLIGALFVYLLRERRQALMPFVALPIVGLLAGAMLAFARDGHGAGMWLGAAIASALPTTRFRFENA